MTKDDFWERRSSEKTCSASEMQEWDADSLRVGKSDKRVSGADKILH